MLKLIRSLLIVATCASLGACASNFSAAYSMYKALEQPDPNRFANFETNTNFQYLEVHSTTSQAMLVLGYTTGRENQPPIQTWYDSQQQLLRLQHGFLISVTGMTNAIPNTEYTWATANADYVQLPNAKTYSQPDQQIFDKTVNLAFKALPASAVSTKNSLLRQRITQQTPNLKWYQETNTHNNATPFALYAFAPNGAPVYGSQCLTANECVEWLYRTNTSNKP